MNLYSSDNMLFMIYTFSLIFYSPLNQFKWSWLKGFFISGGILGMLVK